MLLARVPGAPLDRAVALLWTVQAAPGPRRLERVLPTGMAQVVLNLAEDVTRTYDAGRDFTCVRAAGSVLSGPRSAYAVIDTDEQYDCVGATLTPVGVRLLFGHPANACTDTDVSLDLLWRAADVERLRTRLLEAASPSSRLDVLDHAFRAAWRERTIHPAVTAAVHAFMSRPGVARVDQVVAQVGYSARYLIERSTGDVGLSPKRFCRVRRFQQALTRAFAGRPDDWSHLALDCGFADQSHLVNEFRAFSGLPPTGYLDRRTAWPNHVRFLQDEAAAGR